MLQVPSLIAIYLGLALAHFIAIPWPPVSDLASYDCQVNPFEMCKLSRPLAFVNTKAKTSQVTPERELSPLC